MYMIFSNLGNFTVKVSRYILKVGGDISGRPSGCADKDPWQQEKHLTCSGAPDLISWEDCGGADCFEFRRRAAIAHACSPLSFMWPINKQVTLLM